MINGNIDSIALTQIITWDDGTICHFRDGQLHRDDGPAVSRPDGLQAWYIRGLHHREDGPASIFPNGYQEWFLNGILQRTDGPVYSS